MSSVSLYSLITKTLQEELNCEVHNLNITRINRQMKLICDECEQEDAYSLQSLFENPIGAILWYNKGTKHTSQWVKKNIQQQISIRLNRSKQALQKYMQQLQLTIKTYCQNTLKQYSTLVDNIITNSAKSLSNLQRLNELYSDQLQEQINGNNISFTFLGDLIYRFLTLNQNPSQMFSNQTQQIINSIQKFPYLNTQSLTSFYEQLCDPFKWKLSNFIKDSNLDIQIFQNVDSIHLADRKHYLRYGTEGVAIYSYDAKIPLSINNTPIDECGEINGFKIYGYNQDQIIIFSYINPNQLSIVNRTSAKFPTNLSYQHPYLYYKSENVQWKWNPIDQPQPLTKPAFSQFFKPKQSLFRLPEIIEPVVFKMDDNFVTLSK